MASGPRFYDPYIRALDAAAVPVPLAELNFYLTTSDTRAPTYSNYGLTIANSNPVIADDAGVFPDIFLDPTITYKVVKTAHDDGIVPPFEFWTADPVKEAWPTNPSVFWDQPLECLGGTPPVANETMGMYVAARPQRIFGDFDGTSAGYYKAVGACLVPPTDADVDVRVFLNNNIVDAIGFMTIVKTTGAFVFSTNDGLPIDLDANEFITFVAPPTPDSTFADSSWTITGINL